MLLSFLGTVLIRYPNFIIYKTSLSRFATAPSRREPFLVGNLVVFVYLGAAPFHNGKAFSFKRLKGLWLYIHL